MDDAWAVYAIANNHHKDSLSFTKKADEIEVKIKHEIESIESKLNSITNFYNTTKKNSKVESKILSADTNIQIKLDGNEQRMRSNEEKRDRLLKEAESLYNIELQRIETKKNKSISKIENDYNEYRNYLISERSYIETKKDIVIKDLSSNIVTPSLGNTIDEDANPKLVKLKLEVTHLRKKAKEEMDLYLELYNKHMSLLKQQQLSREREFKEQQREEAAKEAQKQRNAEQQLRQEKALKQQQDEKASMERLRQHELEQERLKDEEEHKIKLKAWKKNLYATMPVEYKNYYSNLSGNKIQYYQKNLSSNEEIIAYVDTIKDKLDKYIALNKYIYDSEDVKFKHYDELTYDQRFEIAQITTKIKKIEKIKEYYALNEEENKEYPVYA